MRVRHIVIFCLPDSTAFFHFVLEKTRFLKKKKEVTEHKSCVWGFCTIFSEIFLIHRINDRDVTKDVYLPSCTIPVILVRFY